MSNKHSEAARPKVAFRLYRHFNGNNELLYIGVSLNAVARLAQHRDHSIRRAIVLNEHFEEDGLAAFDLIRRHGALASAVSARGFNKIDHNRRRGRGPSSELRLDGF